MKRIISLFLVALFLLVPLSVSAESEITVLLDGEKIEFDQPPVIISDRTMVPVRAIYEALGAEVEWDAATRTASGVKSGIKVSFTIDKPYVSINYNEKAIDAPATIVSDRTLVPVRALAEGFGVKVDWDGATRTVKLTSNDTTKVIRDFDCDGDICDYIGQVKNNKPHGYGTATAKEYNNTYLIGCWEDGKFSSGRMYIGDAKFGLVGFLSVKEGVVHGYSEIEYTAQEIKGAIYHGNWENGVMSGYGEFYMPDGMYYKGEFKNNEMHGYGEVYDPATDLTVEGYWQNGEFIG